MRHALPLVLLAACFGPERPQRPDFLSAPTVDVQVSSIQFLTDREVSARLDDLARVARTDTEPRVRDQVVLRLRAWAGEPALDVLHDVYRNDAHVAVADAALAALTELCAALHGPLQPATPPAPPVRPPCVPVYDGSRDLPHVRPVPRLPAADFWAGEGVATKVLSNGEILPMDPAERDRVLLKYADPEQERRQRPPLP